MKHERPCRTGSGLLRGRGAVLAGAAGALALWAAVLPSGPASARDTDTSFSVAEGQNAYILLDASSSMYYPVYESSIDYAKLYDWYRSRTGAQLSTLLNAAAAADTTAHTGSSRTAASSFKSSCSNNACSVGDVVTDFRNKHFEKNRIYLFKRGSSSSSIHKKGNATADQTDPNNYFDMPADLGRTDIWSNWIKSNTPGTTTNIVDTCTVFEDGALKPASGCKKTDQRLTTDADGWVLLDGVQLPYSLKTRLHETDKIKAQLKDGEIERGAAVMSSGFEGMLQAPGYYLSGYTKVAKGNLTKAKLNQNTQQWFFATGNYLNHVQTWGLVLKKGNSAISTAEDGDGRYWNISWSPSYQAKWLVSVIPYQMSDEEWPGLGYELKYPEDGFYAAGESGADNARAVEAPGAKKMQVHFASLNLGEGDHLELYAGEAGDALKVADYTSANNSAAGFWSDAFDTDVLVLKLVSDNDDNVGTGYHIDRFRTADRADADEKGLYVLQSRAEVARQALNIILDKFTDIHWGFYEYAYNKGVKRGVTTNYAHDESANYPRPNSAEGNYTGGTGDFSGAVNLPQWALSAGGSGYANFVDFKVHEDNDEQRALVKRALERFAPNGNTPTQMSLQELWLFGFHKIRETLAADSCSKNMIIHLTDGFPTNDHNYEKFKEAGLAFPTSSAGTGVFGDWDGDGLTNGSFAERYDDIAQWMYEHSFVDGAETNDKTKRVTVHNVAFGARMDILKNASEQTPGAKYLMAGNKAQLIAAFSALAEGSGKTVNFTAPTVSASPGNKLESGLEMYSANFVPRGNSFWMGNVKKYRWGDKDLNQDVNSVYNCATPAEMLSDPVDHSFKGGTDCWGDRAYLAPNMPAQGSGGEPMMDDGVGEVMLKKLIADFAGKKYYSRPIYTVKMAKRTVTQADGTTREECAPVKDASGDFEMVKFHRDNIDPVCLGEGVDTALMNKIINFVYGYSWDADDKGDPVKVREWPLGAIIHSQPVTIDYYDTNGAKVLQRYVAVGGNDAMLHVFDDGPQGEKGFVQGTGAEVFSFIPQDMLPRLRHLNEPWKETRYSVSDGNLGFDGVDGSITIARGPIDVDEEEAETDPAKQQAPLYLIFGERRGGGHYWCLDIGERKPVEGDKVNWKARWDYSHPEIDQSWSEVILSRVLVDVNESTGKRTYRRVAVFSGGYYQGEDFFPEPFDATGAEGGAVSPLCTGDEQTGACAGKAKGAVNADMWSADDPGQDVNRNGVYDIANPDQDEQGRGIFVVDLEDPYRCFPSTKDANTGAVTCTGDDKQVLPFTVTWEETPAGEECRPDDEQTGNEQKRCDMRFSFPATPGVVSATDVYYADGERHTVIGVMRALYVPDIYANLWKARLDYTPFEDPVMGTWSLKGLTHRKDPVTGEEHYDEGGWKVTRLFSTEYTVNSLGEVNKCRAGDPAPTGDDEYDATYPVTTCTLDKTVDPLGEEPDGNRDFDRGQKAFYTPSISWGGTRAYFDPSNFNYNDPVNGAFSFKGRDSIATVFYGTGDPEHPRYGVAHNRLYAIYDDSAIYASQRLMQDDWAQESDTVKLTLPCDGSGVDYEPAVNPEADSVLLELTLECNFEGSLVIPANVTRLTINTGEFSIIGASGTEDSPDGKAALRLRSRKTEVVLKGRGVIKGGRGHDEFVATNEPTPTPVTLPTDPGDFTLPVTDDGAVAEISLTDDFKGTLTVPANVKKLILNLNGNDIEGADGDAASPDGKPAIRLANPDTIIVVNGPGKIEGGEGADESAANPAGRGGDAIAGADGSTVIVAAGGADVQGGSGGDGQGGNPDAAGGSICGLDGDGNNVCVLLDDASSLDEVQKAGDGGNAIDVYDGLGNGVVVVIGADDSVTLVGGAGGAGEKEPNGADGARCADETLCETVTSVPPPSRRHYKKNFKTKFTESNLMNLTCGELNETTEIAGLYLNLDQDALHNLADVCEETDTNCLMKERLRDLLTDDPVSENQELQGVLEAECREVEDADGNLEMKCAPPDDDRKGWYIVLDRQGDVNWCSHVNWKRWDYNAADPDDPQWTLVDVEPDAVVDNHRHEQVMSRPTLVNGVLYLTTYQPNMSGATECGGGSGNGRLYAINYEDASSAFSKKQVYDLVVYGDVVGLSKFWGDITGVPSAQLTVRRLGSGLQQVLGSMDGKTISDSKYGLDDLTPSDTNPPLRLYYWRDSNSRAY